METFLRETSPQNQNNNINPWYITGLIDGEGSFTFNRCGHHMNLCFAMKLTAQDRCVLTLLQNFFGGIGKIYHVKARISNSGKTKTAAYFRITRVNDLLRIKDHFEKYPLKSIKNEQFKIWKEMLIIKRDNFKKKHIDKLESLVQKLSILSPRNQIWHE